MYPSVPFFVLFLIFCLYQPVLVVIFVPDCLYRLHSPTLKVFGKMTCQIFGMSLKLLLPETKNFPQN